MSRLAAWLLSWDLPLLPCKGFLFFLFWILCFLEPTFFFFLLLVISLGRGTLSSFLKRDGRKVKFFEAHMLNMPLLNYCTWLVVGWIKNSRLEIIFSQNFRHCFIEYLMPCGSFVWKLEICFFLPSSLKVFQIFFLTVLEFPVMCFVWVCFSPFCVCLVGPLEFSFTFTFLFFFFFFFPETLMPYWTS